MLLAILQHRGLGFFGMEGPLWFFLGLCFLIALCVVFWKFLGALMTALGVPAPWGLVIYWGFVLFCLIVFWNYSVSHWW